MNNIQLQENEYEAWYIGVREEDLEHVYTLAFEKILLTHGYLHLSTMDACSSQNWIYIYESDHALSLLALQELKK